MREDLVDWGLIQLAFENPHGLTQHKHPGLLHCLAVLTGKVFAYSLTSVYVCYLLSSCRAPL